MTVMDLKRNKQIFIVDTTLRDGEQTAGVVFSNQEKIMIADMLSDLGVDQLEVGIPTMGGDEKQAIKDIVKLNLKSSIMAWNRAVISDIEQSIDCGVDAVAISISVSDIHIKNKLRTSREWVIDNMVKSVEFAKKNDIIVSYDPNYRKMLWKDEETAIKGMRSILSYVDIIKISDEEIHLLTDTNNPQDAAKELMDKGIDCVIVTLGSKGAYIATRDADVLSPCPEGKVVDTTGAGDSFMGAFLYRMSQDNKKPCELTKEDITDYAEFANKVATIVVGRRGALNSMPSIEEVENLK